MKSDSLLGKIGVLNLLLVFVPAGFAMKFAGVSELWLFAVSGAAIIPLAGLMGKSTEMIAHRLGPGIGGLLNASFGNAAELIIAISALKAGLVDVVKASITGSILGNILLVLGASFFFGGLRHRRQKFNATAAGMSATLLALAAVGLLVPAIFHAHLIVHHQGADEKSLSLEIAIVLFVVYVLMLLFSLITHRHLYNPSRAGDATNQSADDALPSQRVAAHRDEDGWPQWVAVTVLVVATLFVALMSEILVGAIEETAKRLDWTNIFVGVVVIAIVGNAAEHSTAVRAAWKNQMELGFQIAVGSGLQVALFVAPVLVFVSYLPGFERLDLVFSMLEVVAVAVSVLIVGLVAFDGESNWLEGLLLLAVYLILGIAFYHLPGGGH
ncbi:MAG: calcium/proton exchanger [Planctomycetaceae bacterium]